MTEHAGGPGGRAPRVLVILGPTASGKSALALDVAGALGAEIVSADSMQVYRGLDIGTAKPTPAERALVPHHLIDVADFGEPFSVATYQHLARLAVAGIAGRGRLAVVVGGTGLYVRALLYPYDFSAPGRDAGLRALLAARAQRDGPEVLHAELRLLDPPAAARIHPRDERRIVRALEVLRVTGRPLSSGWVAHAGPSVYDSLLLGLNPARDDLYRRIERRVDRMIAEGLVEEVRGLVARGYCEALVSGQALGYKEIVAHLRGQATLEEAVARVKQATRNLAKRQMTWFRHEKDVIWLDPAALPGPALAAAAVGKATARWGRC